MRSPPILLATFLGVVLGGPAAAAPVTTHATLRIAIQGLAPITLFGSGTVSVTGSQVVVPAGLVAQVGTLIIPVCGTTAVSSIVATGIGNLAGTFSPGGVTAQAPGELCGSGPAVGRACNVGGGIGGVMGLTGVVAVHVVPHVVVIPVDLNEVLLGQGGSATLPFSIDAAAWTTGQGRINTGVGVVGSQGARVPFSLVTPTFVSALGNVLPIFAFFQIGDSLPIPEPGAAAALAIGITGLTLLVRRRNGS